MKSEAYTGRLLERELLDEVKEKHVEYLAFNEMINWVKGHQPIPDNSRQNSDGYFARDLNSAIRRIASRENNSDMFSNLKFYTAVSSPLDPQGVDGFFEIEPKEGLLRVCIDLTQNEQKEKPWGNTDLVIYIMERFLLRITQEQEQHYNKMVEHHAKDIIQAFKNKKKGVGREWTFE